MQIYKFTNADTTCALYLVLRRSRLDPSRPLTPRRGADPFLWPLVRTVRRASPLPPCSVLLVSHTDVLPRCLRSRPTALQPSRLLPSHPLFHTATQRCNTDDALRAACLPPPPLRPPRPTNTRSPPSLPRHRHLLLPPHLPTQHRRRTSLRSLPFSLGKCPTFIGNSPHDQNHQSNDLTRPEVPSPSSPLATASVRIK